MTIEIEAPARPPIPILLAGAGILSAIGFLAIRRIAELRDTSIEDDYTREAIALILLVLILICFILRRDRWARHLTAGLAMLVALYVGMSIKIDSRTVEFWLPAFALPVITLLLYVPPGSSWFEPRARGPGQLSGFYLLIPWGVFLLALWLTQTSYWETFTFQGHTARAARDGNPLFGFVATLAGFYLFRVHLSNARPDDHNASVHSVATEVALASLAFLTSLIFPAKSLGYFVLLTGPVQLIAACAIWGRTVARAWPSIARRRAFLITYLLGLIAIGWPFIFVLLIARHGIH